MKSRLLAFFTGIFLASVVLPLQAADLMQVYYQAVHADPTFKKAEADWQSAEENLPIARAAYLPQLDITGDWEHQYSHVAPLTDLNSNGGNTNTFYLLTLTQPIFNLGTWKAIQSAGAGVKSATATFAAAEQDLMLRSSTAYFSVLQAYDQLRYTLARKRAVYQQLQQAEEQFKVGLIAITGVYDARSVYDQAAATAIADQNRLNDTVEQLRAITGKHYTHMKSITYVIPLVRPAPNNINAWVRVAEHQNYSLRAQDYSVIAARETIQEQKSGWMPQVNFVGTYTKREETTVGRLPAITTKGATAGLQLNFPLIQGGLVSAQTKQAEYNYLSASSQLLFLERQVISETRQAFLGVVTGIAQVKADAAAVASANNALEATKVGYGVGTRTMVDVLDDLTSLYQEQQRYTDDQYNYILDTINLKADAGTLKPHDLEIINSWLKKRVRLNLPRAAFGPTLKPEPVPPKSLQLGNKKKKTTHYFSKKKVKKTAKLKLTKAQVKHRMARLKRQMKQDDLNTAIFEKTKASKKIKKSYAPETYVQLPKPSNVKSAVWQLPAPRETV